MSAYAETNDVEITIIDDNNDIVNPWGLHVTVSYDDSDTPIVTLDQPSNPINLSLEDGKYVVNVYRHDMFVGYYFMNLDSSTQIQIPIVGLGGTVFNLSYADHKPLPNAKVEIFSHTGTKWAESVSGANGKTERFWLQIPQSSDEYYSATISLEEDVSHTISKFRFGAGYNQENVISPWNSMVEDHISIQLYKTLTQPISKYDGDFIIEVYDIHNEKVTVSKVGDHGESSLSSIPTGYYFLRVLQLPTDSSDEPVIWTIKRLLLHDGMKKIDIFGTYDVNVVSSASDSFRQIESPDETCNCVAFRLDNLQDFYLVDVQQELIDLFLSKNVPVTVGIIGDKFGNDVDLVNFLKTTSESSNLVTIANHGTSSNITTMDKDDQFDLIQNTNNRISDVLGMTPSVFIPSFGNYNADTISALKKTDVHYVSSVASFDLAPYSFNDDLLRFPATTSSGFIEPGRAWHGIPANQTFNDVKFSIRDYGFAVVLLHPHEYSQRTGWVFEDQLDVSQFYELSKLIDEIQGYGLKVVAIDQIDSEVIHIEERFPKWFKSTVSWWVQNKISDSNFITSVEYLVEEKIIRVPQTERDDLLGTNILLEFKNNASLWVNGEISDNVFIDDIQILIKQGIIQIS